QERNAEQNHRQGVPFAAHEHKILREEEREGAKETDGIGAHQTLVSQSFVGGRGQNPGDDGDAAGSIDEAAKEPSDDKLRMPGAKQKDDHGDVGGHRKPEDDGRGYRGRDGPGETAPAEGKKEE